MKKKNIRGGDEPPLTDAGGQSHLQMITEMRACGVEPRTCNNAKKIHLGLLLIFDF